MPSKSEKKRLARLNERRKADAIAAGLPIPEPIVRRKARPKLSAARPEKAKAPRRSKKPEEHPLDKARHKITQEEHNAGTVLRVICEKMEGSGYPSSHGMLMAGGGAGFSGKLFSVEQAECYEAIKRIACAMSDWEFEIVRKVCGEAWPMADAVHAHAICHPDGVLHMFRNALNHLKDAIAKARVSWKLYREGIERETVKHASAA